MPSILEKIVATKREELAASLERTSRAEMMARARDAAPPRGFRLAIRGSDVRVVAEIKKASPAAGLIRPEFDAAAIARAYQAGGAAAISVLTDRTYFQGSLEIFEAVRDAVGIPLLRKDFTIDPYQIYEARAAGADVILLIVSILDEEQLRAFLALSRELGMDTLVEVHTAEEMELACRVGADLIGINNRNLKTFETRLETTSELAALAPPGAVLMALSGISSREHVETMARSGAHAVLVGESLMRQADVESAVREIVGVPSSRCQSCERSISA
ncbi:MAG: indole-3-glycerol phosphate synthase TrpC [Chloroflexi bacterium]|nr:indole-3-glycerol phosphate synthase TrpC [Chloroflexota bacterium]